MGEAGSPRTLSRGVASPGEESFTAAIAVQAIEAQPAFGQIEPMRGQVLAGAEQHFERRRARYRSAHTRGPAFPAKEKETWRAEGRPIVDEQTEASALASGHGVAVCRRVQPLQSKSEKTAMSRSCLTAEYPR
jgi:hypothetical protein